MQEKDKNFKPSLKQRAVWCIGQFEIQGITINNMTYGVEIENKKK